MMCPMGMGAGPKLLAPLVIMALGYGVLILAVKQSKAMKTLGVVIGAAIILVTGLMFAKAAVRKCASVNKSCPMQGMVK